MADEQNIHRPPPEQSAARPAAPDGFTGEDLPEERPQDYHPDFYGEKPREDFRLVDLDDLAEEAVRQPDARGEPETAALPESLADFDHPADLAEHLETLPLEEQVELVRSLPREDAADALVEMEEAARTELLEQLDTGTAADLVGEMSPDDAADILDELDAERRDQLLERLEDEDAEEIRNLMAFAPDTAGSLMNTEIVLLDQTLTVDEAIKVLRQDIEDKEIPYYAYIVDEKEHLTNVLSLRDLLMSPRGTMLQDINKNRNLITVAFDQDSGEVAQMFGDYNFMALPVVDREGHILGIITHDDVIDLINELASGDMLGMVGAGQDESIDTAPVESVQMRLPWLVVNMLNSAVSALVVYLFDGSIAAMPMLAVFMPMVANQAGNTGQQALAVLIRQLALEKLERKRAFKAIRREVKVSLCNGLILAALVWTGVYLLTGPRLATVMVAALVMDMFLGALAGASIPLILKRLGRDPAQASSIFLTAITDGAGFFIFLGLATLFLF
ncbi:MAG: magnesium transporter [Deltaproteobacteria bacterium]|jgi:magnesium transporter|nr:magnesium transporter [Deltaproteobacteria bacterium]